MDGPYVNGETEYQPRTCTAGFQASFSGFTATPSFTDLSTYPPTDGPTTQDVKNLSEILGKKLRSIFDKYVIP